MDFPKDKWCYILFVLTSAFMKIAHSAPHKNSIDDTCNTKIADIVFAIDASTSIWDEDFVKQTVFVENLIDSLPVGKDKIHIGILTFGTKITEYSNLNDNHSKKEIKRILKAATPSGGGTNTAGAIKYARELMFNAPSNGHRGKIDKIMVVITDGISFNLTSTTIEASVSRNHGITMMAVGVGLYHDDTELRYIANKPTKDIPSFLLKVKTFENLEKVEPDLEKTICKVIHSTAGDLSQGDGDMMETDHVNESDVKQYCGGKPADVYFVLDSSSSITTHNFKKMLNFVTEVVGMFDVGPKATRIGVLSYSHAVHSAVALNSKTSKEELQQQIKRLHYLGGGTNTGTALQYVRKHGYSHYISRQSVAHVLILLTDGQSTDTDLTMDEAEKLKKMGVYIFALGIGEQVDKEELYSIASAPRKDFLFEMEDFDALSSIKNILAIKTCKAGSEIDMPQSDDEMCSPKQPMDIMFVFDEHSLGEKKANLLIEVIEDVMATINSLHVRSGVIMHSCEVLKDIPLSSYRHVHQHDTALSTTQSQGLPLIIRKLRLKGYSQDKGGRDDAKNVAFIIIDGSLAEPKQTVLESKRLRFSGRTEVYVIAIGDADFQSVSQMASKPIREHLLSVKNFSDLFDMKNKLLNKICV